MVVYRHPGSKINDFVDKFDSKLSHISRSKLPCLIAGDINIDLKKYQYHPDTKSFFRYIDC